jgi:hypothetical protein
MTLRKSLWKQDGRSGGLLKSIQVKNIGTTDTHVVFVELKD